MNKNIKRHLVSFIILSIFILLAIGSIDTDKDRKKVELQSPSYIISAHELYKHYKNNEVAADEKFKGRVVVVSGRIRNIGKDIMDQPYIVIGGQGFLDGVQCTFTKDQKYLVAQLSKGQYVKVKGEVSGKMGNVLVNKCTMQ
ncbi:MAG: hypothetical protein PHU44_12965 [Syntrophales bacterium]|nr:hypothetical protein [Syntrophales bacterium]MDD5642867.1 hypothetical protein [Syntrophales bacterium]